MFFDNYEIHQGSMLGREPQLISLEREKMSEKEKLRDVVNGVYRAGKEQWGKYRAMRASELDGMALIFEAMEEKELQTMCRNFSDELKAEFRKRFQGSDRGEDRRPFPPSRFQIGTKILREIDDTSYPAKVLDPEFEETDSGDLIFKAVFENGNSHPVALPIVEGTKGMTCFCRDELPDDWIYFEVVRLNRQGKSVMVKPVSGSDEELFELYDSEKKKEPSTWNVD